MLVVAACTDSTGEADTETSAATDESDTDATEESESDTSESDTTESDTTAPLEGYDDPALWLCHPDKAEGDDYCRATDLTATEIHPDGTTSIVEHTVADDPAFDCFYVYPTVDLRLTPGQTENFDDVSQELDPLLSQAAPFSSLCRVFAPLYHQVTIGTFSSAEAPALLDAAYQDVLDAFESWRDDHLGDRRFVIMGHSQGTYMTTRLLQEQIETDDDLRERLIVGLMIGGGVGVPEGELVGGSFATLPLCTSPEQTGCVLAHRTYAAEFPPGPGDQSPVGVADPIACTDVQGQLGNAHLSGAYFPTSSNQAVAFPPVEIGVDTPFVLIRDFYTSSCMTDPDGHAYLAIDVAPGPGDVRTNPIDFAAPLLSPSVLGLHVLDYNFVLGDLLDLVALKAGN